MNLIKKLLIFFIPFLYSGWTEAQTLTQRQIFERCYAKLVRSTPPDSDSLLKAVVAGSVTGPNACKALLSRGRLQSDDMLPNLSSNPERERQSRQILHTMNDLHMSWFQTKTYKSEVNECLSVATNALVGSQEPAYFLTKALLGVTPFDSVVTSTTNLRAVRTVENPTVSTIASSVTRAKLVAVSTQVGLPDDHHMISNGDLLGIKNGYNPIFDIFAQFRITGDPAVYSNRPFRLLKNLGGGALGSQPYLTNNLADNALRVPNLEQMPRTWAKNVFEDFLCRSLPVINPEDGKSHLVCATGNCAIHVTQAEINDVLPYRQNNTCLQCHTSMDQLSGVIRGARNYKTGTCNFEIFAAMGVVLERPWTGVAANTTWGYKSDKTYFKRPSTGRFVYRTYNNQLLNLPITSLADLGAKIADTDDFYICAAKRYYRYFTGIDADISSMTNAQAASLPPDRKYYRSRVIDLGKKLRDPAAFNKHSLKLIEAIFDLPEYKLKDMRLREVSNR